MRGSLREQVLQHCARPEDRVMAQAMDSDELLGYLRQMSDPRQEPLDAVLSHIEAIGDPALPSSEQRIILRWLGLAFSLWERDYPLEEPVATLLRQLKPLAAGAAITDPSFLQPGAHPLHQLLDTAQASAVGWQERLGRAGEQLQKHMSAMSQSAVNRFAQGGTDIAEQLTELQKFAERDKTKLRRMEQRLVETEEGQAKTALARLQAAQMINTGLRTYPATQAIGELIKGPWYASAQLVLLKFGIQSPQWQQFQETTETLLTSLQPGENEATERQQLFEIAARLPKNLRRWLMTLHHDAEALDHAVGVAESAHMQLMRNQQLDLQTIDTLPETGAPQGDSDDEDGFLAVAAFDKGQWFLIENAKGSLRAQLVLKKNRERQLLFANQAGIKTLKLDFSEFTDMLTKGKASPLNSGVSFSISLAHAAGLTSTDQLLDEGAGDPPDQGQTQPHEPERGEQPALRQREQEQRDEDQEQREQELREQEQRQREQEQREEDQELREQALREQEQRQREQEQREEDQELREQALREQEQRQREQEQREEDQEQREQALRKQEQRQREQELREQELRLREQALREQELRLREQELREQELRLREQELREQQRQREQELHEQEQRLHEQAPKQPEDTAPAVPMGTWLRFLDGDTPFFARLAVQQRSDDLCIFVNRKGMRVRELQGESLQELMQKKQVDILAPRTAFKDLVDRAREKQLGRR